MSCINRKVFKERIESKIKHIFDTSTRTPSTLGLGGNGHKVRTCWDLKPFKEWFNNNFHNCNFTQSIKEIEARFPNGLVIVLVNYDYFTIENSTDELELFIYSRIGSDEPISAVILIESVESTCLSLLPLKDKLKERNLKPLSREDRSNHFTRSGIASNANWKGDYAINLKGGVKDTIKEGNIHLANPIYDYASSYTQDSIEYQMTYMMLCSKDAHTLLKDESKFEYVKEYYRKKCELRGLLDFEKFGISNPIGDDGYLKCCVLSAPINASDFMLEDILSEESIQYCHIIPKSFTDVTIVANDVHTTFRPYNIGWGKKWANRWQGNDSVENLRSKIKFMATQFQ